MLRARLRGTQKRTNFYEGKLCLHTSTHPPNSQQGWEEYFNFCERLESHSRPFVNQSPRKNCLCSRKVSPFQKNIKSFQFSLVPQETILGLGKVIAEVEQKIVFYTPARLSSLRVNGNPSGHCCFGLIGSNTSYRLSHSLSPMIKTDLCSELFLTLSFYVVFLWARSKLGSETN